MENASPDSLSTSIIAKAIASLGESGLTDTQLEAMLLPDTVLPAGMTADEEREACRALKGSILRLKCMR